MRNGGIDRLAVVVRVDLQQLAFADRSFDVVTMLGVPEHVPDPLRALRGIVAAAWRFVRLSVPSVSSDNPEHLHRFGVNRLRQLAAAGCIRATIEHVLNHHIVVIRVAR